MTVIDINEGLSTTQAASRRGAAIRSRGAPSCRTGARRPAPSRRHQRRLAPLGRLPGSVPRRLSSSLLPAAARRRRTDGGGRLGRRRGAGLGKFRPRHQPGRHGDALPRRRAQRQPRPAARSLSRLANRRLAGGQPTLHYSVAAKVFCTQTAFDLASDAVQVFGGIGLTKGTVVEMLLRDARASLIEDGANDVLALAGFRALRKLNAAAAG